MAKVGLQSTNPEVLANIRHRHNEKIFTRSIRLLQDEGIPVHLQLIAGLPGDTLDGLKRSVDFAIRLNPDHLSCYTPLLLSGSYLHSKRHELSIKYDERPPHRIFSHYSLSYDGMLECLEFAYELCAEYNSLSKSAKKLVELNECADFGSPLGESPNRRFFSGR